MAQQDLQEKLTQLAAPLAASLGLMLWGMEISFGQRSVVRIFVETADAAKGDAQAPAPGQEADSGGMPPAGVSIEQCASFSRLLGLSLEVEDLMPGAYVLEVSSPGLERTFFTADQLAGAVGKTVAVTLLHAPEERPERRKFRGILTGVAEKAQTDEPERLFTLRLEDEDGELPDTLDFTFAELKKARQVHVVPEKTLPGKGGKKKKDAKTPVAASRSGSAEPA